MSMMYDAARAQSMESASPDDYDPGSALDYMLEQGDHDIVIDLLRGMLAKRGMTGPEIDKALEGECARWLAEAYEDSREARY